MTGLHKIKATQTLFPLQGDRRVSLLLYLFHQEFILQCWKISFNLAELLLEQAVEEKKCTCDTTGKLSDHVTVTCTYIIIYMKVA